MSGPNILSSTVGRFTKGRRVAMRWERYRRYLHDLFQNPLTLFGMTMVVAFLLAAIFAPFIAPPQGQNPYQMPRNWDQISQPPLSEGSILGTTSRGGDVFYGLVWGARLELLLSIFVVTFSTAIGVVMGSIAGFVGGWVDEVIMRVVDALLSLPALVGALAIVTAMGISYRNIAIALVIMLWGGYARIIRAEVIHVKNEAFVDAARVTGLSEISVFVREVLPNAIPPIFVQSTLYFGRVVLIAATLAFIGLAQSGTVSWGTIISMGQQDLVAGFWWTSLFPGVAIFLWSFSWNMIGDGLRDILDPRSRTDEQ